MRRQSFWLRGLSCLTNSSLRRNMVWNCLVAASNLAAVFTCGERYEASILSGNPMAPSMAHPKCIPYLRQKGGVAARRV